MSSKMRFEIPSELIGSPNVTSESSAEHLIDEIEEVRVNNNCSWMDILRIAHWYAPDETKRVLRSIRANDLKISELMGKLGE